MSSTVATPTRAASMLRDPVLLAPAVVVAGLGIGWLGIGAGASGGRVAADIALSWTLLAASLVALERRRWKRSRALLALAAFTLLAADLQWAGASVLWTLGFLLDTAWIAVLVQVVLTFPEGRAWSGAARVAIVSAYVATFGAQLIGVFLSPDSRDVLSVARQQTIGDAVDGVQGTLAVAAALGVLWLLVRRLRVLRGPARRAQAPLLLAAAVAIPPLLLSLAWMTATGEDSATAEAFDRWVALLVPLGLVAGLSWSRLRRSEASDLVVELRADEATSLRERLANVLGDPTVDVLYRLGDGRHVDAAGRSLELPHGPERAITLVTVRGEEVAALVHDPALLDEPALVEAVRATAGLVLENERLAAEVRAQLAEVRASRTRIVAATDAERRRIERNLHDGAQQRLVTLSLALGIAAARQDAAGSDVLAQARDEVDNAIAELRELARGIHPTLLREEGLLTAVKALARRTPLPVTVEGSVGDRLPDAVELAAYFLVSEALTNVVKHAAASQATVRLERMGGILRVVVADDGVGGARAAADSGLAGLRDRLEVLDARLIIDSRRGAGTSISVEIPCG
jgi:signal transduction histidine kinase